MTSTNWMCWCMSPHTLVRVGVRARVRARVRVRVRARVRVRVGSHLEDARVALQRQHARAAHLESKGCSPDHIALQPGSHRVAARFT